MQQIKQMAMSQAMKLMSNPKVTKLMSDPRLMNALAKGFEIHGQVRSQVEGGLRALAETLNLATKDEVVSLRRKLNKVQDSIGDLKNKTE